MIEELSNKYKTQGLMNIKNKNISLAINSLMEGIRINNKDVDLLNILGLVFYKKCKFNEASYLFKRSVVLDRDSKGNEYLKWMESEKFIAFLEKYNRGIDALNLGENDLTIRIFKEIARRDESLIEPYVLLTEAYMRKGEDENAGLMLKEVCARDIGEEKIQDYKKILNRKKGCISGSLQEGKFIIETSFNHTERAEFRFLLGLSYEETGEYETAIEEYKKYLEEAERKSYEEVTLYNLSKLCNKLDKREDAIRFGTMLLEKYSNGKYNDEAIKEIIKRDITNK